jgi:hypothetical protein
MGIALIIAVLFGIGIGMAIGFARRPDIAANAGGNHRDMARWIDKVAGDDMVRVTIPEDLAKSGDQLLNEFYGRN